MAAPVGRQLTLRHPGERMLTPNVYLPQLPQNLPGFAAPQPLQASTPFRLTPAGSARPVQLLDGGLMLAPFLRASDVCHSLAFASARFLVTCAKLSEMKVDQRGRATRRATQPSVCIAKPALLIEYCAGNEQVPLR